MEEPRARRPRLQSALIAAAIAVSLLGPLAIGVMLPVPDFVREWPAVRQPTWSHYAPEGVLESDELQDVQETWERIWFLDEPDELTPERVHGGVI